MNILLRQQVLAVALALAMPTWAGAQSEGTHAEYAASSNQPATHHSDHATADHHRMHHVTPAAAVDHAAMDHGASRDAGAEHAGELPPSDHVPPPAPTHEMGAMSNAQMVAVMGMDDRATFGMLAFDRLEHVAGDGRSATAWSAQGWFGGDLDKFRWRSEGTRENGALEHADLELSWGHAVAPFWDSQIGVRRDFGRGLDRTWAAFGLQGLAPYWFELAATAYVGDGGRTALRVEAEYEWLLTQRWVLQPRLEFNAYGKDDPAAHIGSGLSDAALGLRLRYEIRRELAPYVGVERSRRFGRSADFARMSGGDAGELQWVAGVRFRF